MKTLKVCMSEHLPLEQDRDINTIYYLYDKLLVFNGKTLYNDPYVITERMPADPANGILYFTLNDGKVKSYIEYKVVEIANIENSEQLDILKKCGTSFFNNSNKRHLDLSRRIVTLPYLNGTYELTVSLANDLIINENTKIAFNPATNMFEMVGDDHDVIFRHKYEGKDSMSVRTKMTDARLMSGVKISQFYNNIIKCARDGLYVNVDDRVEKEEFEYYLELFTIYKNRLDEYMKEISPRLDYVEQTTGVTYINNKILEVLKGVYPEIDDALAKFKDFVDNIEYNENRIRQYIDDKYATEHVDLYNIVYEMSFNPWLSFDDEMRLLSI